MVKKQAIKRGKRKGLSAKDREIALLLQSSAGSQPRSIPKSVGLSEAVLHRLADHCEATGRKLSFHGMTIV